MSFDLQTLLALIIVLLVVLRFLYKQFATKAKKTGCECGDDDNTCH